jgi:hypothetical protein
LDLLVSVCPSLRKARRSLIDPLYASPPTVESQPTRALAGETEEEEEKEEEEKEEEEKEEEEGGSAVGSAPTSYYYWLSCWPSFPETCTRGSLACLRPLSIYGQISS